MTRILIILLLTTFAGQAETTAGSGPSITLESTAVSQYLWRGYVLNSSASLQPAVTLEYAGFTVSNWANFSKRVSHNQAWTENDVTLEYAHQLGRFSISAGFLEYGYPELAADEGNRSHEVSLGVAYSHYLNPSIKAYRDLSLGKGYYYFLGVTHTYALRDRIALTPSAGIGLNQHMYQQATTISDVDCGLSLDLSVSRQVTVSPTFLLMSGNRSLFGTHYAVGVKAAYTR